MIVDELVSLIRFDMPSSSKTALSGVNKAVSKVTDSVKSLGIVSAVTSSIFAAFSVNAAKDVQNLNNLSKSTGVSVKEIEALGAMYRKVGGDAKTFAQDAAAFKAYWKQDLNLEKMISLSRDFSKFSDEQAFQFGRSINFSDDMIRLLLKGPEWIQREGFESILNNTTSESALENLSKLREAYVDFTNEMNAVGNDVQGGIAPALTEVLKDLHGFLRENKEDIVSGANAIGDGLSIAWGKAKEAGKSIKEALKPAWEVLDAFVVKHGGWEDAITGVVAVVGGLVGITVPAKLIFSILSFTGVLSGLKMGASGLAAVIGAGGPLLLAFAAVAAALYIYRDEIGGVVDGLNLKFDGFIAKTKEFQNAAKNLTNEERKEQLAELKQNHVGASAANLGDTAYGASKAVYDTAKVLVTTGDVGAAYKESFKFTDEVQNGLKKQTEMNLAIGEAIREEVSSRAGEEVAEAMDGILGGRGWAGSSRTAREYAELIADAELVEKQKTVSVPRPSITPQRMGAFPDISPGDLPAGGVGARQGGQPITYVTETNYYMNPPTPTEQMYHNTGGTSYQSAGTR